MTFRYFGLIMLPVFCLGCATTGPICSRSEAIIAEETAATLNDWNQIHLAFKKYGHCDDGAISEGYSESVSRTLANRWDLLSYLEIIVSKDKAFGSFVLRHIDQTIADDNRTKIFENASARCPKESRSLCEKIKASAKSSAN